MLGVRTGSMPGHVEAVRPQGLIMKVDTKSASVCGGSMERPASTRCEITARGRLPWAADLRLPATGPLWRPQALGAGWRGRGRARVCRGLEPAAQRGTPRPVLTLRTADAVDDHCGECTVPIVRLCRQNTVHGPQCVGCSPGGDDLWSRLASCPPRTRRGFYAQDFFAVRLDVGSPQRLLRCAAVDPVQ